MGSYSRWVPICYFGQEGGRLFGGGCLFEEKRYLHLTTSTINFGK